MQKLVVGLPHATVVSPCGGCENSCSKRGCNYERYAGNSLSLAQCNHPVTTTNYQPYTNNMSVINSNFEYMSQQMMNLHQQISGLNGTIADLNRRLTEAQCAIRSNNDLVNQNNTQFEDIKNNIQQLRHEQTSLNQTIQENTDQLAVVDREIKKLVTKMGVIISFIPQFVKETTKYFTKLLIGIKTDTLDQLGEPRFPHPPLLFSDNSPISLT